MADIRCEGPLNTFILELNGIKVKVEIVWTVRTVLVTLLTEFRHGKCQKFDPSLIFFSPNLIQNSVNYANFTIATKQRKLTFITMYTT